MTEDEAFRENEDVLRGMESLPPTGNIPLPERQLFTLERARRDALSSASAERSELPPKISRPVFPRTFLLVAAAIVIFAGLAWQFLPKPAAPDAASQSVQVARIVITSPGDIISSTRPRIAWTSKDAPSQRYDVWILPAEGDHRSAPTLFLAKNVTSPVDFSAMESGKGIVGTELQPGTDYRVLVCLADRGRTAGVPVPFKTLPSAK